MSFKPNDKRAFFRHALLILPSIAAGILAMIHFDVSSLIWGQQLAAWGFFSSIALPLRKALKRMPATASVITLTVILAATLLYKELDGAKRWLDLGIFNINAAMFTLPAALVLLYRSKHPHAALLTAALVLALQPDLSQLSALGIAALPLLWQRREKRWLTTGSLLVLFLLTAVCAGKPVALQPVSYCEGVISLLSSISPLLLVAGCAALTVIPAYFLYRFLQQKDARHLSLALYYAVSMLYILSGEYPVPFMGFGLSPIAGYFLCYSSAAD